MELQWPLILFTFFMCLSSGILFAQSVLALKGEGRAFQNTSLVASFVAMVVGGIAVFLHLQHWERIFNGFGHITSGITQELIGVVLLFLAPARLLPDGAPFRRRLGARMGGVGRHHRAGHHGRRDGA
jgi:DMSO reductase anchor subunit